MSKIASIFLFVLMAGPGFGQQEHFALIRAGNDQPFYVRIRQQTLPSSAEGHLILSQLHDSVYPISVGFPRQQFPEQHYILTIDKNDPDLRLDYKGGKGWILTNMDTQNEQLPGKEFAEIKTHVEGVKKDDAFSRLMADLVSDTAVMYNTYTAEAPHRDSAARTPDSPAMGKTSPLPIAPDFPATRKTTPSDSAATPPVLKAVAFTGKLDSARTDSSVHPIDSVAVPPGIASPVIPPPVIPPPAEPSHIEKISQQQSPAALSLSYAVRRKGQQVDTINIQIPIDTPATARPQLTGPYHPGPDSLRSPLSVNGSSAPSPRTAKSKLVVINSDCHNFALDDDVDKLKAKFQTLPTDDAKIMAAKKVFKLKCFTTSQLKSISESFPLEEAKYRFFETAYPFVSDDGFKGLASLFNDPVTIAKFKTLAGITGQ